MLSCPKCKDMFLKQERLDKHLVKCKGKVCKNCGQIGHIACGTSVSGKELLEQMNGKNVTVVGLF